MKKLFQRFKRNNQGMTLVELVVSIAILSLITLVVGGAMVTSANNYHKGNVEVELQQQSQITANLISNLVLDASTVEYSAGTLTIVQKSVVGSTESTVTYSIALNSTSHQLRYSVSGAMITGEDTDQLLAENVAEFNVDTSAFAQTKNVAVTLGFSMDNREFKTTYNMTSRNGNGSPTDALVAIRNVVLEPGETYKFSSVSNRDLTWGALINGGNSTFTTNNREATITVGKNVSASMIQFTVSTVPANGEETAETQTVTVFVRRVAAIGLAATYDGDPYAEGTKYRVYPSFNATGNTNLTTVPNAINGSYDFREFEDVKFEVVEGSDKVNIVENIYDLNLDTTAAHRTSSITFTLKQKLEPGDRVVIRGTARRPSNVLDGGKAYGRAEDNSKEVYAEYVIEKKSDFRRGDPYIFHIDPPTKPSDAGEYGRWQVVRQVSKPGTTMASRGADGKFPAGTFEAWAIGFSSDQFDAGNGTFNINQSQESVGLEPGFDYVYHIGIVWLNDGEQQYDALTKINNYTDAQLEQYSWYLPIGEAGVEFDHIDVNGTDSGRDIKGALKLGTVENPIKIKLGESATVYMEPNACSASKYITDRMIVRSVELWTAGGWKTSYDNKYKIDCGKINYHGKVNEKELVKMEIKAGDQNNSYLVGSKYRIKLDWSDSYQTTGIDKTRTENTYYNEASERGIMYIEIISR